MTPRNGHSRLWTAMSLAAVGLTATLLLVLVSPVAFAAESNDAHACCEGEASEEMQHADAECEAGVHHQNEQHSCSCHLSPERNSAPADAVAVTASTYVFGPLVAAQTNVQVDVPLAREPDAAQPAPQPATPPAAPIYLLNSVLLL